MMMVRLMLISGDFSRADRPPERPERWWNTDMAVIGWWNTDMDVIGWCNTNMAVIGCQWSMTLTNAWWKSAALPLGFGPFCDYLATKQTKMDHGWLFCETCRFPQNSVRSLRFFLTNVAFLQYFFVFLTPFANTFVSSCVVNDVDHLSWILLELQNRLNCWFDLTDWVLQCC